ncbi:malate dehydrogenase, mitochondrial-like [Mytilus californianus]|uniref:malate dehydrogenase, mitochondrial-like n=1 Tax=Mytilus californianus TaxID=6549 RepID=UPI002245A003|nr:malate dehydrogenase, mitochondrial-like [Mytilus californianus]
MFCRLAKPNDIRTILQKSFSISSQVKNNHNHSHHQHPVHHPPHKVTVLGAGGAVSQPLSLLLKSSSKVGKLCLYDIDHTPGVAADLSHIDTKTVVTGYLGTEQLGPCLTKSDVVLITAGIPRKPGMTEDEQFNTNAGIVRDLVSAIGDFCPKAMICIITNPVNSTLPLAAEVLKKKGVFDERRLFGITSLNLTRAKAFVAEAVGCNVAKLVVPVVGGNSGITIVPLISQTIPPVDLSQESRKKIIHKLQTADTEILETKAGTGSATLSMAHAASKFTLSLLAAIDGEEGQVESAYVKSDETTAAYLSTPLLLGDEGIVKNLGLSNLDEFETELVKAAIPELTRNIQKGIDYANKS